MPACYNAAVSRAQFPKRLSRELEQVVKSLVQGLDPDRILLFGSFARGSPYPWSDIDLLVVKETDLTFGERIDWALSVVRSRRPVEILVYTPQELKIMFGRANDFICTALEEAKVVYEKKGTSG